MSIVSDFYPASDPHRSTRTPGSIRGRKWIAFVAYSLVLVLLTVVMTRAVTTVGDEDDPPASGGDPSSEALAFGSQDVAVDSVTVPAGAGNAMLLSFDANVESTATAASRAAMVSFRVACQQGDEPVEMQSNGKVSTNVFLAHGGEISGQALTEPTEQDVECTLLASAPYIETTDDGLTSLPIEAELRTEPTDGTHTLALHRLDDATLIDTGGVQNVLSLRVDDPTTLQRMSTTVRLTSCTVVDGSSDGGENQCRESMTSRESSTVRIRVVARWLDAEGEVTGTTTYWDETLAVDYNTHHVPWTLRQGNMAQQASEGAQAAVLVVQVENVAGTPFVVHADGTDSVITTES